MCLLKICLYHLFIICKVARDYTHIHTDLTPLTKCFHYESDFNIQVIKVFMSAIFYVVCDWDLQQHVGSHMDPFVGPWKNIFSVNTSEIRHFLKSKQSSSDIVFFLIIHIFFDVEKITSCFCDTTYSTAPTFIIEVVLTYHLKTIKKLHTKAVITFHQCILQNKRQSLVDFYWTCLKSLDLNMKLSRI